MKNNQTKESSKKFNLEKVEILKLDTMRKITGGSGSGIGGGDDNTGDYSLTDLIDKVRTK